MSEKIIKAAMKVVKGESYAAALEAAHIVEVAHAQARQIQEDAEQVRQQAMEAARSEGYEHGLREWNAAVAEVNAARDQYISDNTPELIRLAVRIAQKIIGEELRTNPEAIVCIARECLLGLGRERLLKIRVPTEDVDLVRKRIVLLREVAGPNRSIEIAGDAAISAGGCVVESEYGVIDARLQTQLRCMEEILLRTAGK